jgi:hypothetical protein
MAALLSQPIGIDGRCGSGTPLCMMWSPDDLARSPPWFSPRPRLNWSGWSGPRTHDLVAWLYSRQLPLFIEGVPVYVPYDGNVDLSPLGVEDHWGILVSKGLASLLYGPNTLRGAVNVVCRKPTPQLELGARAQIEAHDHFNTNANRVDASIGGHSGAFYGNLQALRDIKGLSASE